MSSGDSLLEFFPENGQQPTSNFATLDMRNQHPVFDFDDSTVEAIRFKAIMPQHYGGGGITVHLHYSMATATSGNIILSVAVERIGDQGQDVDADGFAAANTLSATAVPGTSGLVDEVTIAFTDGADMDSVAAGDLFRVEVKRPNSTATGDLELHGIEIRET